MRAVPHPVLDQLPREGVSGQAFLLFSGHNERAVIALCRYFTLAGHAFSIVAFGSEDFIYRTAYREHVIHERSTARVDVEMFLKVLGGRRTRFIYCPTTEYINSFLLNHRESFSALNIDINLPNRDAYERVTSKRDSQELFRGVRGLRMPKDLPLSKAIAPCVLKPLRNISVDRVLYPILCATREDLERALSGIDQSAYFAQEYIDGESYYLCGYLSRTGTFCSYWQRNLLQQANGKSIVLAAESNNPGLDERAVFECLAGSDYHGPLMTEVMIRPDGIYYIETNPRFWGPLQLGLDICPAMLDLFATECGYSPANNVIRVAHSPAYYAWQHGSQQAGLRQYGKHESATLLKLLGAHDVFSKPDCQAYAQSIHR